MALMGAAERDAALTRLHGLLLPVARHEAGRRNGWLRLSGPDLDDLARQAALFEARRIRRARRAANGRDLAHLPGAPVAGLPWLDDLLAADPGMRGVI